jgi:ribonucleotide reductase beta subunit family protein with ferritin-like domain
MLGELSEEEIRFLADIKRYSTTLSEDDKKLVLAMIRKMATDYSAPAEHEARRFARARVEYCARIKIPEFSGNRGFSFKLAH